MNSGTSLDHLKLKRLLGVPSIVAMGGLALAGCEQASQCGGNISVGSTARIPLGDQHQVWIHNGATQSSLDVRSTAYGSTVTRIPLDEGGGYVDDVWLEAYKAEDGSVEVRCSEQQASTLDS